MFKWFDDLWGVITNPGSTALEVLGALAAMFFIFFVWGKIRSHQEKQQKEKEEGERQEKQAKVKYFGEKTTASREKEVKRLLEEMEKGKK